MWILEVHIGSKYQRTADSSDVNRYYLVGGSTYTIGRSDATILLGPNDPSVSRLHASLLVLPSDHQSVAPEIRRVVRLKTSDVPKTNSLDGNTIDTVSYEHYYPTIFLFDSSKHGTFVNNVAVDKKTRKHKVSPDEVLRFGAHATARLVYCPIIVTLSPSLSQVDCQNATIILEKLGVIINNPRCEINNDIPSSRSQTKKSIVKGYHQIAFRDSPDSMLQPSEISSEIEHTLNSEGNCYTTKASIDWESSGRVARVHDDTSKYISPDVCKSVGLYSMAFLFITDRVEISEPSCMMSMLLGYRPCDLYFISSLYDVILENPTIGPSCWPEPRIFENVELADMTYMKPPTFHPEFLLTPVKTFESAFRMVHFGFLSSRLLEQYSPTIVRGGGKASFLQPEKVIDHFSLTEEYQSPNAAMLNSFKRRSMSEEKLSPANITINSSGSHRNSCGTRKVPHCLKLLGVVDDSADAHGLNLLIVIQSSLFTYLADLFLKKEDGYELKMLRKQRSGRINSRRRDFRLSSTSISGIGDTSKFSEKGFESLELTAALHFFYSGYNLIHQDNIHCALYTSDTCSQIAPTSPGVLARSEILYDRDITDSDETVGEESSDGDEYNVNHSFRCSGNGVGDSPEVKQVSNINITNIIKFRSPTPQAVSEEGVQRHIPKRFFPSQKQTQSKLNSSNKSVGSPIFGLNDENGSITHNNQFEQNYPSNLLEASNIQQPSQYRQSIIISGDPIIDAVLIGDANKNIIISEPRQERHSTWCQRSFEKR